MKDPPNLLGAGIMFQVLMKCSLDQLHFDWTDGWCATRHPSIESESRTSVGAFISCAKVNWPRKTLSAAPRTVSNDVQISERHHPTAA